MEQTQPTRLAFGAQEHVDVLCQRLHTAFEHSATQDPMVIGLFGEWGCGKSLWLEHIGHHFCPFDAKPETVTLPVPFNAWRYEAEEHLIVPLLKTAEQQLKKLADAWPEQTEKELPPWRKLAQSLGVAAVSIGAGLKGELQIPLVGKIGLDVDKMLLAEQRLLEQRKTASLSEQTFPDASSIYFNFHDALRHITGRDADKPQNQLNLLFLIDDLDRCLPEKAVQLLESIKLFLDVAGCGFVLALDEEVIERGIAHRYQDYNKMPDADMQAHPITGSEYLEKIIHLPIRIPRPRENDIPHFLQAHHPAIFGQATEEKQANPDQALMALFQSAIPPVPRKLHRAAELLQSKLEVARSRGWNAPDKPTLARLTLLELFAPEVYRFARRRKYFALLHTLETWVKDSKSTDIKCPAIQHYLSEREKQGETDEGIRYDLENFLKPLHQRLCQAAAQRSGFEPLKIIDLKRLSVDKNIANYFDLRPIQPTITITKDQYSTIAPSEPERFFSQLFSNDIQLQKDALEAEREHLQGKVLDNTTVQRLEKMAAAKPEIVSVDWLERLASYLYPADLDKLVLASQILARLQQARRE